MTSSITILIVDDDPFIRDSTRRSLEGAGYSVLAAENGQTGLRLAAECKPELLLLDVNLPRVSGLEVLERLRLDPRTHLLPIVILTSSDEERDRLRSYETGANSFVRKPLDFAEFVETVAQLGVYWLVTNEPPEG